jgi:hypothetical protein
MIGAPLDGWTTCCVVDGRELDALDFGLEWVDLRDGDGLLVLGGVDVGVAVETVEVGVGTLERARVGALDEHAAVTPRTHTAPATSAAKRSEPRRLTPQP